MITKEDFNDYEDIRRSGKTNMFNINVVIALSNSLDKAKCFDIMSNYSKYKEQFT